MIHVPTHRAPTRPGEMLLEEFLEPMRLTQQQLADGIHVPYQLEQLSPLRTTFCPMEYEAMLQACRAICRFYQDVAPHLAKEHDMTYQADLEQLMLAQLKTLSESRPKS